MLCLSLVLRVQCWVSLVLGLGVPSAVATPVVRRDKDKWNDRAFQVLVQATVARWIWFSDWVSPLFPWLPEGTMEMDDTAKLFTAFIQAPVSSLFWYRISQYLKKRRKVPSVPKFCVLKKTGR